ncbi:MAG: transcription antitermination factor NusB [Treponema sp.]|nr:transcription antitermination factor NusB [Treponema sp.]
MSRRNARILAFQALYSWDVSKASLEDLLAFSWLQKQDKSEESVEQNHEIPPVKEEQTFAGIIIAGTIEKISEIDSLIESHLSASWSMERLNKVTLAILRTSIYEMKYMKGAEKGIVIDEAINISKQYGSDDSYKFINAVLDKIGKDEKKA